MKYLNEKEVLKRISFCKICSAVDYETASCSEQGESGNDKWPLENIVSVGRVPCARNNWEINTDYESMTDDQDPDIREMVLEFKKTIINN